MQSSEMSLLIFLSKLGKMANLTAKRRASEPVANRWCCNFLKEVDVGIFFKFLLVWINLECDMAALLSSSLECLWCHEETRRVVYWETKSENSSVVERSAGGFSSWVMTFFLQLTFVFVEYIIASCSKFRFKFRLLRFENGMVFRKSFSIISSFQYFYTFF